MKTGVAGTPGRSERCIRSHLIRTTSCDGGCGAPREGALFCGEADRWRQREANERRTTECWFT
eukprot:scaffold6288_cov139-Isochrysis_galbana.AAC.2